MKKFLLLIGCLLIGINSANALTLNEDGSYTNKKGATITSEQYTNLASLFSDRTIDIMSQRAVLTFSNPNTKITTETEYSITTDTIQDGEIIDSITIKATEEEAKKVASNKNLHVLSDKRLHNTSNMITPYNFPEGGADVSYQTSSKRIQFVYAEYSYGNSAGVPTAIISVDWFTIPMIKKYDIMAMRWNTSRPTSNVALYEGEQSCWDKNGNYLVASYNKNSENLKVTNYGLGQIMNIFDDAYTDLNLYMWVEFSQNVGNTIFATYQHARNSNITLSQAKSYSFSANGLGNVVYFSNSTVRNYYDGMQGVQANLY